MRKSILASAVISSALFLTACGGGQTEQTNEGSAEEAPKEEMTEAMSMSVAADESHVMWTGGTAGAMVYSHYGTIAVKSGSIEVTGEQITAGEFVIDMTSINPTDSGYGEENPKENLIGHLSTGDFFEIEKFPTASFVVKSHEGNTVTGDLTIRDKTNEESITIEKMEMMDGKLMASGQLVFDRQKYDVAWEHYLKDVILSDDIKLDITLVAK